MTQKKLSLLEDMVWHFFLKETVLRDFRPFVLSLINSIFANEYFNSFLALRGVSNSEVYQLCVEIINAEWTKYPLMDH